VLGALDGFMTNDQLSDIEQRCNAATSGPWQSFIEGRDHSSGSSFIRTGGLDNSSPDIELYGASHADYDFIAHARQDIPALLSQIRRVQEAVAFCHDGGA